MLKAFHVLHLEAANLKIWCTQTPPEPAALLDVSGIL